MALEERENFYEKVDLLDHADLSRVEDTENNSYSGPSRKTVLAQALGKDESEIKKVSEGGYQGTILFVFEHTGYLWLLKDAYGSCSGCDGMLAAVDHEDYARYVEGMCNNAYAFDNAEDAITFLLEKKDDGRSGGSFAYGWGPLVDGGLDAIDSISS